MLATTSAYNSAISASVRKIKAKVELYNGSTLVATYTQADKVISFDIQRVGEDGKFFGFGICHRLNVHLIDVQRELDISTANTIKISLGAELPDGAIEYKIYPTFQVSEVHRDENTNELSVTAYDAIYKASEHTVSKLALTKPYTIKQFVEACASTLGVSAIGHTNFILSYPNGANFDGTETLREALDDVAEATQTIYFLDANNKLCFKQLDKSGNAVITIDKSKYMTLKSGVGHRLQTICMCTELGDNVSESTTLVGSTQYVRDNAFWELRDDIAALVHNAITTIGNISIDVFDCTWRGNPALEVGDKIALTTKDNKALTAYLLNDTIKYDGSLSEKTQWKYDANSTETESNSLTLTEVSYSVANNTSEVRMLWTSTQTGQSHNVNTRTGYYVFNGSSGSVEYTLPANTTVTIFDETFNVSHNSDGTGSVSANTWMDTRISAGEISKEASLTLTTIPRASSVSCSAADIGSDATITINRASANFTHTLTYDMGNFYRHYCYY